MNFSLNYGKVVEKLKMYKIVQNKKEINNNRIDDDNHNNNNNISLHIFLSQTDINSFKHEQISRISFRLNNFQF